jgi:hypothetical protein
MAYGMGMGGGRDSMGPEGMGSDAFSGSGGSYTDDAKKALSKFYDNYVNTNLTEKEKKEVSRISQQFNIAKVDQDLVRHYVIGQRYSGMAAPFGVGAAFLGEALTGLTAGYGSYGGFSPDDVFGTLYGTYGYSPAQVNQIDGFKHTESWQEMDKNKSKHQGFWGQNIQKMRNLETAISPFGININSYMDSKMEKNMDLDFNTNISGGLLSQHGGGGGW